MDKIKDPAMLLTLSNTVAIIGITMYGYKQMESHHEQLLKLNKQMLEVIKQIASHGKFEREMQQTINTMSAQIKEFDVQVKNSVNFNALDKIKDELNRVVDTLEDNDIVSDYRTKSRRHSTNERYRPPITENHRPTVHRQNRPYHTIDNDQQIEQTGHRSKLRDSDYYDGGPKSLDQDYRSSSRSLKNTNDREFKKRESHQKPLTHHPDSFLDAHDRRDGDKYFRPEANNERDRPVGDRHNNHESILDVNRESNVDDEDLIIDTVRKQQQPPSTSQ